MRDPYEADREAHEKRVLDGPGVTEPSLRRAAAAGRGLPAELAPVVEKIHRYPYKVTDEDVAGLKQAGWSEDALFEVFVAASLGAARQRLDAALAALEGRAAGEGGRDAARQG